MSKANLLDWNCDKFCNVEVWDTRTEKTWYFQGEGADELLAELKDSNSVEATSRILESWVH